MILAMPQSPSTTPAPVARPPIGLSLAVSRGLAAFLGVFSAVNLVGGWLSPGFDATVWWIDLRFLPAWLAQPLLVLCALVLLAFATRPSLVTGRRVPACAVAVLAVLSLANAVVFWRLLAAGRITSAAPLPISLLAAAGLG